MSSNNKHRVGKASEACYACESTSTESKPHGARKCAFSTRKAFHRLYFSAIQIVQRLALIREMIDTSGTAIIIVITDSQCSYDQGTCGRETFATNSF